MTSNPLTPAQAITELLRFAQHAPLCLIAQWKPTDEEDFDCPECTCGLVLLEKHARAATESAVETPAESMSKAHELLAEFVETASALRVIPLQPLLEKVREFLVDSDDESCQVRSDGLHCNCWYDGKACCACKSPPTTAARCIHNAVVCEKCASMAARNAATTSGDAT